MYAFVLSKADSLIRTNTCTCSTLCAEVCVDSVDIALRDSLYWTLADTCTTSDTIVADYVSHFLFFFMINNVLKNSYCFKAF